ncbi:MAG TPA: non-canonical purine NTP pyrophosphatase [Solirubrobacteraceae bacterium]
MKLVLATGSRHKLREFGVLVAPHVLEPLADGIDLGPEIGLTFAENALGKAVVAARAIGAPAIGDDSGIQADALGGAPGIYSRRYAGETATDAENLAKLIREAPAGSGLAYVCALAFVDPGTGEEIVFEGRCTGRMSDTPRGEGGFGYDPVFIPDDGRGGLTMAELSDAEKHAISHRGRAVRALLAWLDSSGR